MVNTFVVSSDFQKCAEILDNKRLGKQRVEAMQILDIILKLHIIANYFSLEKFPAYSLFSPNDHQSMENAVSHFISCCKWVDSVLEFYEKNNKKYLARINGKLVEVDSLLPVFRDVRCNKNDANIVIDRKKYSRNEVILPLMGDTIFSMGFSHHPIVKIWVGFEDALRSYTNFCIEEWVDRGFSNTMKKFTISSKFQLPWWVYSEPVILAYKSNLIRKDPVFYGNKFPGISNNLLYIWPSMLEKSELLELIQTNHQDSQIPFSHHLKNNLEKAKEKKENMSEILVMPLSPVQETK